MCIRDKLLNGRPHVHIFLHGLVLLQCPIKSCPTHLGQLAHVLDPYPALPRHHRSDLGVDARAPDLPLCRRRASTLCKAPLKKSTSKTFSASTRFRWLISFRSVASREVAGGSSPRSSGSSFSRQVYNRHRLTPSSFARSMMLSHWFSRSTAICRKAFGNLPTRFLATCHPLRVSSVPIRRVSI